MTQKLVKFQWSAYCQKFFAELKTKLSTVSFLALPECSDGYVIYSDASIVVLGCVSMQQHKVIAYVSRDFKDHEKKYPTHELDLVVVLFVLNIWRHHFHGIYADKFTYHKRLHSMFTQKELNLCQRRWLELLEDYDMMVYYHPSKANVVADDLSRLYMGTVSHVENERKDLVMDVHRLGRLGVHHMSILDSDGSIKNGAESSFVVEVKENQDIGPILLELKGVVRECRFSPKKEMVYLATRVYCVIMM